MRVLIAIGCYLMSAWSLSSALDRATRVYRYSYVGGDAYNMIINGTHTTALVVCAAMLALLGTLSLISLQLTRIANALEANADDARTVASIEADEVIANEEDEVG